MNKQLFLDEMRKAMKNGDSFKKELMKVIISELDRIGKDPNEKEIIGVLKKMVKNGEITNTEDSKKEIKIINEFLPKQMSENQIIELINKIKSQNPNINGGRLIGVCMKEAKGLVDGKVMKDLVNKLEP